MTNHIKSEENTLVECQENIAVAQPGDERRARSSGKGRGMKFLMKISGAVAVLASMALAGCVAQEGDEALSDEALSDEALSDEALSDEAVGEAEQALQIGLTSVTCNSGWPGTRGCFWRLGSATDIVPGSITVQIEGHNGALGYSASQSGPRTIDFSASVREGDAFNPGKNTTKFLVAWFRQ
ncbi:uncharacterized protein SOCE26_064730 [Sorangium cellulosum]|uniref:Uncharacterized protein n=2 Tax=Sorangium cellulosum TaxID=56 RepID=A0A2L0F0A5_SORCE|nr:uncharacterized protein SOCE26_064730 [Sorangium cellulosum]